MFKFVEGRSADVVVITHKDRLARFGFEYIEEFLSTIRVKIEAVFRRGAQRWHARPS